MSIEAPIRYVRYSFTHGPGREEARGGLLQANCQAWVHADLRMLDILLPEWMLSKEIAEDEELYFRTLQSNEPVRRGDVYGFGSHKTTDVRRLHLAIHSGYVTKETGEPILTHANVIGGSVSAWPVSWFAREPRYARLFVVKRPLALE